MSSIVFDPKGFLALEEEGADFINYVLEKTNDPFTFSKQADFEPMLDMLEKYLKIKGKANADLQLLLYKVQKAKKLLNKLHECLNDIEKNKNKETEQALINAICGEVSLDELEQLYEAKLPSGDFYHYNGIRSVLKRKLNGEIEDTFFGRWLMLLCRVFNDDRFDFLSDYFAGYTHYDEYNANTVLEMMATLKDFNYKLLHNDFLLGHNQDQLKVIYLRFLHCNRSADSRVFKAYFVDYKRKRFDIRMIDDAFFDYRDDLMYCDIWSKYFDEEGEYIDSEGEYDFEPAELEEEKELMYMFYYENWTYDHELNF